ncbi:MAG: winged helix-turn-helix domain-containing protein, partial [Promethearchaeota archaeon]
YIYYGAADKRIAVVSVHLNKLLHELLASDLEAGIGFLAGQIFNLTINEEKTLAQLKTLLNQKEYLLLMAIGWLIRENKVLCRIDSDELIVRSIM